MLIAERIDQLPAVGDAAALHDLPERRTAARQLPRAGSTGAVRSGMSILLGDFGHDPAARTACGPRSARHRRLSSHPLSPRAMAVPSPPGAIAEARNGRPAIPVFLGDTSEANPPRRVSPDPGTNRRRRCRSPSSSPWKAPRTTPCTPSWRTGTRSRPASSRAIRAAGSWPTTPPAATSSKWTSPPRPKPAATTTDPRPRRGPSSCRSGSKASRLGAYDEAHHRAPAVPPTLATERGDGARALQHGASGRAGREQLRAGQCSSGGSAKATSATKSTRSSGTRTEAGSTRR